MADRYTYVPLARDLHRRRVGRGSTDPAAGWRASARPGDSPRLRLPPPCSSRRGARWRSGGRSEELFRHALSVTSGNWCRRSSVSRRGAAPAPQAEQLDVEPVRAADRVPASPRASFSPSAHANAAQRQARPAAAGFSVEALGRCRRAVRGRFARLLPAQASLGLSADERRSAASRAACSPLPALPAPGGRGAPAASRATRAPAGARLARDAPASLQCCGACRPGGARCMKKTRTRTESIMIEVTKKVSLKASIRAWRSNCP